MPRIHRSWSAASASRQYVALPCPKERHDKLRVALKRRRHADGDTPSRVTMPVMLAVVPASRSVAVEQDFHPQNRQSRGRFRHLLYRCRIVHPRICLTYFTFEAALHAWCSSNIMGSVVAHLSIRWYGSQPGQRPHQRMVSIHRAVAVFWQQVVVNRRRRLAAIRSR